MASEVYTARESGLKTINSVRMKSPQDISRQADRLRYSVIRQAYATGNLERGQRRLDVVNNIDRNYWNNIKQYYGNPMGVNYKQLTTPVSRKVYRGK